MKHFFIALFLVFAALLFMGAGRIGEQVKTRKDIIRENREHCSRELKNLQSCLPEKDVEEWVKLAGEDPILLLQATSPGFSPLQSLPAPAESGKL